MQPITAFYPHFSVSTVSMILPCKPLKTKLKLTVLLLFFFPGIKIFAQDGKALFISKCASCHNVFKDATGPRLGGVFEGEFYGEDIKKFLDLLSFC